MSRSRIFRIAAALVLVAGVVAWGSAPPSPAPLPRGATPLALRTQPPSWRFLFEPRACPQALLLPVRLVRDGPSLAFVSIADGHDVSVVFPYGFTGRLNADQAELVAPERVVLALEGQVLSGLSGSSADNGDFLVCFTQAGEYAGVVER
jgi:hypothetical protein